MSDVESFFPVNESRGRPPLLFVHGIYHGGWCFLEHFVPWFVARGYPCHVLTLRGHRGGGVIRTTRSAYINDLREAFVAIDPAPVVVGHSLGGMLVQALLAEGVVSQGVLLATPTPLSLARRAVQETLRLPRVFLPAWLRLDLERAYHTREVCRDSFFSAGFPDEALDPYVDRLRTINYGTWALLRTLFAPVPRPQADFAGRVLVVGGANDPTCTPAVEQRIARRYGTDAVIVDGVSHDLMLDTNWRGAAAAIATWLEAPLERTDGKDIREPRRRSVAGVARRARQEPARAGGTRGHLDASSQLHRDRPRGA
jgi:pimeloyl-ACP methyl ester carboxylesterase